MSKRGEQAAVYVTHRAIDSGSVFRLDEVPGVKKLDLDQEIQRISESTEDLKDLWLDGLPDELVLDAWTTDLEFARVMNKIRQSKAAMTFRVVWTNGVTFDAECFVERVMPPLSVGSDLYNTLVGLRRAQQRPQIGFRGPV